MRRTLTTLLLVLSFVLAPAAPLWAQTEENPPVLPTPPVQLSNQALLEKVTALNAKGATAPAFVGITSVSDIERLNWSQRATLQKEIALASQFSINVPNACSDSYTFNSVETTVETDPDPTGAGGEKHFTIHIKNNNPFPIVDAGVYVKMLTAATNTALQYQGIVDQFIALSDVSVKANETVTKTFTYKVPIGASPGRYEVVSFVSVSDAFPLAGIPFMDDVRGGSTFYTVRGEVASGLAFDRSVVFLNNVQYDFNAWAPAIPKDSVVQISVPVKNELNVPLDANITWKLYKHDQQTEANLLETATQTASIDTMDTVSVRHTITHNQYASYVLVGEMEYQGSKSLINIRFLRSDVPQARITFAGLTNYPPSEEEGRTLTLAACVHAVSEGSTIDDTTLVMKLTDEAGEVIHEYRNNDTITLEPTLLKDTFTPSGNPQVLTLTTSLERNGETIESVSTKYDCQAILGTACIDPGVIEILQNLPSPWLVVLGAVLLLLLLGGGWYYRKWKKRQDPAASSVEYTTPTLLFFGLLLAGAGMFMPVGVEAQFNYFQGGTFDRPYEQNPWLPAVRNYNLTGSPVSYLAPFGMHQGLFGEETCVWGGCNTSWTTTIDLRTATPEQACEHALSLGVANNQTISASTFKYCAYEAYTFNGPPVGCIGIGTGCPPVSGITYPVVTVEIYESDFPLIYGIMPNCISSYNVFPSNNPVCAIYTFAPPAPLQPDLTATTNGPMNVLVGQANNYTGTVRNVGSAAASGNYNSYVAFYDNPSGTVRLSSQYAFTYAGRGPALSPGGSGDVGGSFTFNNPGTYYYRLCTEWDNEIAEPNDHWYDYSPYSNCGAIQTVVVKPTPPTGFTHTCNAAGNQVTLSWNANPGAFAGYYVRLQDTVTGIVQYSNDYMGTSVTYNIISGHSQSAWIHTETTPSNYSDPASFSFTCPPPAPTGLAVVPAACNTGQNNVSWNPAPGALGYDIWINGSGWFNIGNVTSYAHTGLAPLSANEYYIRAWNAGGAGAQTGPIWGTAPNLCTPTALLQVSVNAGAPSASDRNIDYTDTVRISWTSTDATTCTGTGFNTGGAPNNVTGVVVTNPLPGSFTNFSISCTGSGGTGTDGVRVTTNVLPLPIITLTSSIDGGGPAPGNKLIAGGQQVEMQWSSTLASTCTGINAPGLTGINGTHGIIEPAPGSTLTYGVRCFNWMGFFTDATFTVETAMPPTVTLNVVINSASRTDADQTINPADTVEFQWSSTFASGCSATAGPGFAVTGTFGNDPVPTPAPATSVTFSITCTGPGGSASDSLLITVRNYPNLATPVLFTPATGPHDPVTGRYNHIDFTFQFTNNGESPTLVPSTYRFEFDENRDGTYETVRTGTIPVLSAGQTSHNQTERVNNVNFNLARVRITADFNSDVTEMNEGDNVLTLDYTIPPPNPNLNLTVSRKQIRDNQTVTLNWSAGTSYPMNCRVFGPTVNVNPSGLSGSQVTGNLSAKSLFTYECFEPLTSTTFSDTETVEVAGEVEEI